MLLEARSWVSVPKSHANRKLTKGTTQLPASSIKGEVKSGVAAETGHHQPDRIVSVYGAAGGPQRKTLARRRSTAALDRHRALGSRKKVPAHQRLSRNPVAKGKAESVSHSAEGGSDSRSRLNRGCYWSNEMRIVSPRASWRGIFSRKTEIVTRKEKRSLLRSLTGQEKKLYSAEHRESLQSTKTRTSSLRRCKPHSRYNRYK